MDAHRLGVNFIVFLFCGSVFSKLRLGYQGDVFFLYVAAAHVKELGEEFNDGVNSPGFKKNVVMSSSSNEEKDEVFDQVDSHSNSEDWLREIITTLVETIVYLETAYAGMLGWASAWGVHFNLPSQI